MIVVIFEVEPVKGKENRYFEIAACLGASLHLQDGFISVERFQSISRPGVFLSVSYWRDEECVRAWRSQSDHRSGQIEGREQVFSDYRIRVASVVRDYTKVQRAQAPHDSNEALALK